MKKKTVTQVLKIVNRVRKYKGVKEIKKWKPKEGEKYYSLCGTDEVFTQQWENDSFDKTNYERNEVFKTRKEAEAVLKKIRRGG